MNDRVVRLGILGAGNVGAGVIEVIRERGAEIARRTGISLRVAAAAVRDPHRPRPVDLSGLWLTSDPAALVEAPDLDVVVEVMGGLEPARTLVLRAIERRMGVVTANKQLLAVHGRELFEAAARRGVDLRFEGSVGGGLPLIQTLLESLAANRIQGIHGILNGTTNYILTRMTRSGMRLDEALAEARQAGFAEADPSEDLEGRDAAAKLLILAGIAFGAWGRLEDIPCEGITRIAPADIAHAERLGYRVKLLAWARNGGEAILAGVFPTLVPLTHPLARVDDEYNALLVRGDAVGEILFQGRGAGGLPTASAVVADCIDIGRNLAAGTSGRVLLRAGSTHRFAPAAELCAPVYLRLEVADRAGVLAAIAAVFGRHQVSIAAVIQHPTTGAAETAELVMITHRASGRAVQEVVHGLSALDVVHQVKSVIRVLEEPRE